ncbi:hypothetical protein FB451DRAFT_1180768 [Mycena latifolia]|nr:hypothetical protein FB451DRAFT_1180768 [Mycena latifolia]
MRNGGKLAVIAVENLVLGTFESDWEQLDREKRRRLHLRGFTAVLVPLHGRKVAARRRVQLDQHVVAFYASFRTRTSSMNIGVAKEELLHRGDADWHPRSIRTAESHAHLQDLAHDLVAAWTARGASSPRTAPKASRRTISNSVVGVNWPGTFRVSANRRTCQTINKFAGTSPSTPRGSSPPQKASSSSVVLRTPALQRQIWYLSKPDSQAQDYHLQFDTTYGHTRSVKTSQPPGARLVFLVARRRAMASGSFSAIYMMLDILEYQQPLGLFDLTIYQLRRQFEKKYHITVSAAGKQAAGPFAPPTAQEFKEERAFLEQRMARVPMKKSVQMAPEGEKNICIALLDTSGFAKYVDYSNFSNLYTVWECIYITYETRVELGSFGSVGRNELKRNKKENRTEK